MYMKGFDTQDLKDYTTMALAAINGDPYAKIEYMRKRMDKIENEILALSKMKNTMIKEVKKYTPKEDMIGYRWTKNNKGKVFLVKLRIEGEYWHDPTVANTLDYVTDSCSIVSIEDIETGAIVNDIGETAAYFHSNRQYKNGEIIDKDNTWFCLSREMLFLSQGQTINREAGKEVIPLEDEGTSARLAPFNS